MVEAVSDAGFVFTGAGTKRRGGLGGSSAKNHLNYRYQIGASNHCIQVQSIVPNGSAGVYQLATVV